MSQDNSDARKNVYRELIDKAEHLQENEEEIDKPAAYINKLLDEANTLFQEGKHESQVTHTDEILLDAKLIATTSDILYTSTNLISVDVNSYDSVDFAERISRMISLDDESDSGNEEIFKIARKIMKMPPCLMFMYGSSGSGAIVSKDNPKKRKKIDKKPETRKEPEKVKIVSKEEDSVDDTVQFLWWVLKQEFNKNGKKPLNYFKFVINPSSFPNTIENIFHFSFLTRDRLASLTYGENSQPFIKPLSSALKANKSEDKLNKQVIVPVTMDEWQKKLKSLFLVSLGGTGIFTAVSLAKSNEKFYQNVLMPSIHLFDPEFTHEIAIAVNKYNILPKSRFIDPPSLRCEVFGKVFSNPVGIAAGFDKQAEAVRGLHDLGFGFVEIGSVTPFPQPGNPKPRVFRLKEDHAVINRYGFNSDGHEKVFQRLDILKHSDFGGIVGVNLGKNKNSIHPIEDYVQGIKKFGCVADYLVINISSPNTPGLRSMQSKEMLQELLTILIQTRDDLVVARKPPLLLKLAPDLTAKEKKDIADVLKKKECRVDGLIISNTTTERASTLKNSDHVNEAGGLSGQPLAQVSTDMIAEMYKLTGGTIKIIGVGGVFTGQDAYDKIKAGASLIQVYTAFIYQGPPCAAKIKRELTELLELDGFENVSEAIGADVKK